MPDQASILGELNGGLAFGNQLIAHAHATDQTGSFLNPPDVRAFITEAAVLKMYICWERYMEQSFLSYLMGELSTTGVAVTSYLSAPTIEHANLAVIGTQKYVDWGNPDIVTRLAALYFPNGFPYKPALSAVSSDLFDLRAVRNAAAHLSTTTSAQLDSVALRRLGHPVNGVTVYDLVTGPDATGGRATVLDYYQAMLTGAAALIAAA
jgi:hypothetical protein